MFHGRVDVYEAVRSRQSIRHFTGRPVERRLLERVLRAAADAPSGSNLQPWNVYVLTGERLAGLKRAVSLRVAAGDRGDEREFANVPPDPHPSYRERMTALGEGLYGARGVARDDLAGRARIRARNWECFGAGTALFWYLDRDMPVPRWADAGIHLQTVMLLLRAEGLDSCAQEVWAEYHRSVAEVVGPPPQRMLFCGMSIGFADPAVAHPRIRRAPLRETVTFLD
jgi:nitroreductase